MQILFSDEKFCDTDGVYNVQLDPVWAPSRAEADKKDEIKVKRKFLEKAMVRLGKCSNGINTIRGFRGNHPGS